MGEECEDEIEALAVKVRFAELSHDATVSAASTVVNQKLRWETLEREINLPEALGLSH